MLSEEGVTDDGRWILMMRRSDVFGDGLVLWEFEDGTGLGLVAVVVRRRGVGRVGGLDAGEGWWDGRSEEKGTRAGLSWKISGV